MLEEISKYSLVDICWDRTKLRSVCYFVPGLLDFSRYIVFVMCLDIDISKYIEKYQVSKKTKTTSNLARRE
jgi:hypothetical protein